LKSLVNLPRLINTAFGRDSIADEMIREAAGMALDKGGGGTNFMPNPPALWADFSPCACWIDAKEYKPASLG
jgi:hypothetical protein